MTKSENSEFGIPPLTGVGLLLIIVFAWTAYVFYLFRFKGLRPDFATVLVSIGGVFATLSLAAGIYYQASQNQDIIDQAERERITLQESEWIPHFYPTWGDFEIISCSGPKPWYPWLKAEIAGIQTEKWYEQNSYPATERNKELNKNVNEADENYDIDWFVQFPGDIRKFFRENVTDETEGKLYFKFETITGEWYFFVYTLELEPKKSGFNITGVPNVDRYLPWQESKLRDKLRIDLERQL